MSRVLSKFPLKNNAETIATVNTSAEVIRHYLSCIQDAEDPQLINFSLEFDPSLSIAYLVDLKIFLG